MNLIVVFTLIIAVCELEALRLEEKTPENDNELVYKEAEADFDATGNQDFSLEAPAVSKAISKRGFTQFGLMILRVLKRNPFDYNGYGCWCGLGGKGLPVDGTDRCCKEHDKCYSKLNRKKICKGNQVFFVRYFFKGTKCLKFPPTSRCGKGACKCDSKAVKCFRRNKRTFNRKYKNWNRKKCKKPSTTTWKSCL